MLFSMQRTVCFFSFFLASVPLFSQENDFQFGHLTIEDGLSNNTVYCVYQDSKGFMWFGTENGLNCYDGYTFNDCSPGDFRTIRLIRAAQQLPEKQSATVAEIAYQVGFTNPAYFAKCFRELYGRNPSEYGHAS